MKKLSYSTLLLLSAHLAINSSARAEHWTDGMKEGKPAFQSMGPLAFGPEGILFVADTKAAAIVAIATEDTKPAPAAKGLKVEKINQKIAALLGTAAEELLINDMAVNPISRSAYIAVSRGRGPEAIPVLVRVSTGGQPEVVSLEKVRFSRGELPDAPADRAVGQGSRQSNPRQESITDISFFEDRVLIAGLSNEEWSSTFRAVPFPFKTVSNGTSIEIYHGAHGKFETKAPVRTFVPFKVGSEPQLLAAYTCTPLVQLPINDLKPGAKVKGKTIAELGNRNRPLDMIVYQKDGKDYLLLANSSRGIMKISTDNIESAQGIVEPVSGGGKKGLPYETIEQWSGVDQLDRLDQDHALVVRKGEAGAVNLESLELP
jgi:hypothetical protein